ncbi:apoptosis inhibitor 5-like protein API5 [Camellia sinensis]|uniref:apoptosis inhibitor 5-like protein API5 n=1 Tax=Camellia sinensis TaxID=4442 RepID=UPI001036E659|nr:apoptosis inhibitor 5-like protein API5 [Camellia sinensis]
MGSSLGTSLCSYAKRLSSIEELARATIKKLTQRMTEHNKAMASAKSDEAKASVKAQKQNTTTGLQTCNNILAMTQLHAKSPSFIGDKRINLSWKEVAKASAPYRCWLVPGELATLRMRGTITFQLTPGELADVPLPSSRCLVNWHFIVERCIIELPRFRQVEQSLFIIVVSV